MKIIKELSLVLASLFLTLHALPGTAAEQLAGKVSVDGSSTVYPITEAMAEEFGKVHNKVRVTVGISGTGGGFKKFVAGEIDISDASRPIKDSEEAMARTNGIEYIELPVAFDGLTVVVNPRNTFVDKLTVQELKKIWQPGSTVKLWSDVREGWPQETIKLYGPGTDSGTFDYFTEAVNGKEGASRPDYTASEDDNMLVQGVAGDQYALGYFGYAYYVGNKAKLKAVPIDGGKGSVLPSDVTINNGTYQPLSRPIFIYVSKKSAQRPEVKAFVDFYLKNSPKLVKEVGYVPLPQTVYTLALNRFNNQVLGSAFLGKNTVGVNLADLLK